MEKNVFTTRKPNIVDRLMGYIQRQRYMRKFRKESAVRCAEYSAMMAEREGAMTGLFIDISDYVPSKANKGGVKC